MCTINALRKCIFEPVAQVMIFMKKILFNTTLIFVLGFLAMAFTNNSEDNKTLSIGEKAPLQTMKMKDVSGESYSLKDKMENNGLLVIFSCNTCPFVVGRKDSEGWEGRYNQIADKSIETNIGFMLVNSNEAKRMNGDSYDDMIKRSMDNEYKMAYVLDKDHELADAFGARTTPHVFLFDNKFNLVYKGAIDDNNDLAADVKETWLLDALSNLSKGEKIDPQETRNIGCSIKRVKKE